MSYNCNRQNMRFGANNCGNMPGRNFNSCPGNSVVSNVGGNPCTGNTAVTGVGCNSCAGNAAVIGTGCNSCTDNRNMAVTSGVIGSCPGTTEVCGNVSGEVRALDDMTPGMAYVPWQTFGTMYPVQQGIRQGTLFPCLNFDFMGRRCN